MVGVGRGIRSVSFADIFYLFAVSIFRLRSLFRFWAWALGSLSLAFLRDCRDRRATFLLLFNAQIFSIAPVVFSIFQGLFLQVPL